MRFSDLVTIVQEHLNAQQIQQLFGNMTEIIDTKTALAVLKNTPDSDYYKENINKVNNTFNLYTKYPDLYNYQYTDAKTTVTNALDKMLKDLD